MTAMSPTITVQRRRFTVADFQRLAECGVLAEDDRVELIGGEIVEKSPVGERHVRVVNRCGRTLHRLVGEQYTVSTQNPIRLNDGSLPQPDLAVLRGKGVGIVDAADVLLVIEVADSSRDYDRAVKLPLYATAGIPEVWLADLGSHTLARHTEPHNGQYTPIALAGQGQSLTSTVLPTVVLSGDDIFG